MKVFFFAALIAVAAAGGVYRQDKNSYYNDGKQMSYMQDYKKDYDMDYNQNYEKAYSAPDYYKAPSPYKYEYAVYDAATYNDYQKQEHSDGYGNVKGSYKTLLPDGRTQIVTYTADKYGYVADVQYSGEAKYADNYAQAPYSGVPSYSSPTRTYMAPKSSSYQIPSYMGKYQPSPSYQVSSYNNNPKQY